MVCYMVGKSRKRLLGLCAALLLALPTCQTVKRTTGPLYTIRVRHISDHESYEDHRARVGEEFFIADTEYSVKVERYIPDFAITLETKEVVSRSDEPNNPAIQLAVSYQADLLYKTWVLYQNPVPHFIHEPGYYFQFISYESPDQ